MMHRVSFINRARTLASAMLREGWWLRRDPLRGFRHGVRKRCGRWGVAVMSLDEATQGEAGKVDGVHRLEADRHEGLRFVAEASEKAWHRVRPGGWFAFACERPVHEATAVFTLHGWLMEQVFNDLPEPGQCLLVLQRPVEQAFQQVAVDWEKERQWWSPSRAGGRQAQTPPQRPTCATDRRCHLFGVGIAKSGTSSLAGMFEAYRSAHEFDPVTTIGRVVKQAAGEAVLDWEVWLLERDRRSGFLECDSSQLHVWYLQELVRSFPEARFVLTVRHPISWLDSLLNHHLARGRTKDWAALDQQRFGKGPFTYQAGEGLLKTLALPPVAAWFGFWSWHHQRVLDTVPPERLLVLELDELSLSVETLAAFAGIHPETLSAEGAHRNEARARFRVVERLDPSFITTQFQVHTGKVWDSLMERTKRAMGDPETFDSPPPEIDLPS